LIRFPPFLFQEEDLPKPQHLLIRPIRFPPSLIQVSDEEKTQRAKLLEELRLTMRKEMLQEQQVSLEGGHP
jgi:hypothetical protein